MQNKVSFMRKRFVSAAFLLVLSAVIIAVIVYLKLQEPVPIHFNIKGEVDGYGSKDTLFILPVIALFVFTIVSLLLGNPNLLKKGSGPWKEQDKQRAVVFIKILEILVLVVLNVLPLLVFNTRLGFMIPVIIGAFVLYNIIYLFYAIKGSNKLIR